MKKITYFLFLLFVCSCAGNVSKNESTSTQLKEDRIDLDTLVIGEKQQIAWTGMVDKSIPVLLHYQMFDSLLVGELVYLGNTKRNPVTIIGELDELNEHRVLEFDRNGNISGIISGIPKENNWLGTWFSPKTRNEYSLDLKRIDTLINLPSQAVAAADITGHYYYQYGRKGQKGVLKVRRLPEDKLEFSILSLTDEPARNIALIDTDTVICKGTSFAYSVPFTDDCQVKVQFYKEFAHIRYTKSDCMGAFGHNASLEGIFYKTD